MVLVILVASTHVVVIGLQGSCRGSTVQVTKDVFVAPRADLVMCVSRHKGYS